MASFVPFSYVLLIFSISLLEFGSPLPQNFVSVGNRFFIVKNPSQEPTSHAPSMPVMLAKAATGPSSSGQVFILRRKNQSTLNYQPKLLITSERQADFYTKMAPKTSFSIPILSSEQNSNRRTDETSTYIDIDNESELRALEQEINSAYNSREYSSRPGTLYGTDASYLRQEANSNRFESNIPLPQNPFMPTGSVAEHRSDTQMEEYETYSEPSELPLAEEGLQNMLNKYLENMYRAQAKKVQPVSSSESGFSFKSPFGSHYSKTSSGAYGPTPYFQEAQSRESLGHVSYSSVLEKPRYSHPLEEVFPPVGSYTPYGERTILMVKYPGMPVNKQTDKNLEKYYNRYGGKAPFSYKNNWNPFKNSHTYTEFPAGAQEPKASDFGVIVSQNFVLQPTDGFGPSRFESSDDGDNSSPGNLVSQLAKALAERNRIINAYSASPMAEGKDVTQKPPFVLVHLESFTKKSNKSGRFGFDDEEVNKNYSNGTIIYPTKNNPNILASTKFEFENINDVVFLFDRPLEGFHNGRVKPIVPVGIDEIKMFLKLVYEVHRDVHNNGRKKVADLKDLSSTLDKPAMIASKPLDFNQRKSNKDNWLHTSSIGLRSLG